MEQHDQPVTPEATPPPAPSNKMRTVAVAATAIALIGISIPFVWHADATTSAPTATVTPAASHEPVAEQAQGGACMADAKPANWNFKLKDLDGKDVELASFKDSNKVVLLNFWATWCGPCKAEIPGFVELQDGTARTGSPSSAIRSTTPRSWRSALLNTR